MVKRFSLRQRFALLIMVIFIVLFGAVAGLLVIRKASSERVGLNEQAKSFATLATKPIGDAFLLYKDSGNIRIQQQITKFTDLNPDVTGVTIVDTAGKGLFSSGQKAQVSQSQASTFEPIYLKRNGTINQAIAPLLEDFGAHRYSIVYSFSDSRIVQDIQHTVAIIVLLSLASFAVALLLTYWLINRFFNQ